MQSENAAAVEAPESYYDLITGELMADPVVDPEGNSYDRRSIEAWLRQHGSSPITRSPLTADRLAPNRALKDAIEAWRAQHPNAVARVAPKPAQGTIAVSVTSYAVAGNEAHSDVVVTLDAGAGRGRVPVDLVCVIDISGSMQDEAKAHNDKGDVESHGLSLLDITKHAVSTIIHSLGPLDRLALVSYSDRAREELPLTTMDSTGQNTADTKLKSLRTEGSTNLWDGLLKGMDTLRAKPRNGRVPAVFLLTDGQPNIEPPRGHLAMLQKYKEDHQVNYAVSTFGFGYNLNSKLLDELATEGGGAFAFIPEATFVGTCFVNAMSNLLVTAATDVKVSVENVNGATIEAVLGDHPTKSASWGVEASLGSLQFGQPRTLVLRMAVPAGQAPFANVALTYATTAGEKARVEAAGSARATSDAVSQSHVARGMATTGINEALRTADKTGRTQAHDQLAAVCKAIRAYCPASHAHTAALLKDLEGQALEALSKQEYFTKWGRHYLPSLSRAHQLMNCNNFKDPGVQVYGGKLFNELRDIADTLFLKLPPPTPSRTKSNGQAYAAPASMSAYNDSDAVCFSGSSLVLMADSSVKRCDEVVAGDVVFGGHVVRCVVKTMCKDGVQALVRLNALAAITAWHPIEHQGRWTFPLHVAPVRVEPCEAVYNFVLHTGHTMVVGGVTACTLAHNVNTGDVRQHAYWGTEAVLDDLRTMPGFANGYVTIGAAVITRNAHGACALRDASVTPTLIVE